MVTGVYSTRLSNYYPEVHQAVFVAVNVIFAIINDLSGYNILSGYLA